MGFGAMSFGGFYGATTETESHATLSACLEHGVTHWDTANVYGPETSENVIGTYFKAHPGARAKVHLATKGSIQRDPKTNVRGFNNSREHLTAALDASLKRLGVDHVDLYYFTGLLEAEQRLHHLFDRASLLPAMNIIEIDVVNTEPLERRVERCG